MADLMDPGAAARPAEKEAAAAAAVAKKAEEKAEEDPADAEAAAAAAAAAKAAEKAAEEAAKKAAEEAAKNAFCGPDFGCSGHGSCNKTAEVCECDEWFDGQFCEVQHCKGFNATAGTDDCHGHGMCLKGQCFCARGWGKGKKADPGDENA